VTWFETGPMSPEDWGSAMWISGGQLMRYGFSLDGDPVEARAYIAGLGYYELRINGSRTGDRVLDPPWSVYEKRIYYSAYDVTHLLRRGWNVVSIILGRKRFSQRMHEKFGTKYYGELRALALLRVELGDGKIVSVVTNQSWRCLEKGPIVDDDIYNGYKYDGRLEPRGWDLPGYDDSSWRHCSKADPPGGGAHLIGDRACYKSCDVFEAPEDL
jgi:alpha-L-rhamnosidase